MRTMILKAKLICRRVRVLLDASRGGTHRGQVGELALERGHVAEVDKLPVIVIDAGLAIRHGRVLVRGRVLAHRGCLRGETEGGGGEGSRR